MAAVVMTFGRCRHHLNAAVSYNGQNYSVCFLPPPSKNPRWMQRPLSVHSVVHCPFVLTTIVHVTRYGLLLVEGF